MTVTVVICLSTVCTKSCSVFQTDSLISSLHTPLNWGFWLSLIYRWENQGEVKYYVSDDKYSSSEGDSKAQAANYSDQGDLGALLSILDVQLPFFTGVGQRYQPSVKDEDPEVKSEWLLSSSSLWIREFKDIN